ncbi:MAG: DUF1501 domain-containing protein, partial [Planctomycetaceae bacterium]
MSGIINSDQLTSRRGFVRAGMLGSCGLSLSSLLRLRSVSAASPATAKTVATPSVIILWMRGGPSQHETWDPKPEAPVEYRGHFGTAATSVPGISLCDMLPQSGRCMQHWSIIRSLHHTDAGHSSGDQLCFTGYPSQGAADVNSRPSCGASVAKQVARRPPRWRPDGVRPRR